MNELVTVRTFSKSIDFELAKSYLESCEIECFGRNEIINRAYVDLVDGGIQLQVREEQVEEAVKLLFEKGYLKAEDFEPLPEFKWMGRIIDIFKHKK